MTIKNINRIYLGIKPRYFSMSFLLVTYCILSYTKQANSSEIIPAFQAEVISQGFIEPFGELKNPSGKAFSFEPSATYIADKNIYLLNDRPMPSSFPSQLIGFSRDQLGKALIPPDVFLTFESSIINGASKIEGATQSFDSSLVYATTSFSQYQKKSASEDSFNTILAWPAEKPEQAKILNSSEREGVKSSRELRKKIKRALSNSQFPKGPKYFKIEGLAFMPGNKLALGIRSMGQKRKTAQYQFIILSADLSTKKNSTSLTNFKIFYQQNDSQRKSIQEFLNHDIGISSLEYDKKRGGLFILTSHETEKNDIGAYLWFKKSNQEPKLIKNKNNEPLYFSHKSEGMTILDNGDLLIIHDDDREQKQVQIGKNLVTRKVNQGIYSIVRIIE